MVSIIIAILGFMMTLAGVGLRAVVKSFGTFLSLFGILLLGISATGHFLTWTNHRQLTVAGGAFIIFFLVTAVWQLIERFRPKPQPKK